MVQTPNGLKAIETFKPGDLVYSKDQFTQAPGVRPVVATKQTLDQLIYEVVVKNAQGQTETYTTTSEHPFWVTNGPC
jgi:filamentous hemagglutinin